MRAANLNYVESPSVWMRARNAFAIWNRPRTWLVYSIAFGVVAPLVCFAIATWIGWLGLALWPVNLFVLIAVSALAARILRRREWKRVDELAAGVLIVGAVFALPFAAFFGYFGIALLCVSVFEADAEALVVGLLGVQPILSLVAYSVNAFRAHQAARGRASGQRLARAGAAASIALPFLAWLALLGAATATERAILATDRPLAALRLERWRILAPSRDWPELRDAYMTQAPEPPATPRDHRIADAYLALTGKPIDGSD